MPSAEGDKLIVMANETCLECRDTACEDRSRWLILDETGCAEFNWKFMCIQCVTAWRKRGLERQEMSAEEVPVKLNKKISLMLGVPEPT